MPTTAQTALITFRNKGMVTKLDKEELGQQLYEYLLNVISVQEGKMSTRSGTQGITLVAPDGEDALPWIHTLGRVATGADESANYRYLGSGDRIYRIDSSIAPAVTDQVVDLTNAFFAQPWSMISYKKFVSGTPYGFFATPNGMFVDPLTDNAAVTLDNLLKWGLDRPTVPVLKQGAGTGSVGTLNGLIVGGGLTAGTTYYYVFTFRDPRTGAQSNPCMLWGESDPLFVDSNSGYEDGATAALTIFFLTAANPFVDPDTTSYIDPRIDGLAQTIVVYRRGGAYFDGIYRQVMVIDAPSGAESVDITDNIPDIELDSAPTLSFDNDTPVTASLPVPFRATLTEPTALGFNTLTLQLDHPSEEADIRNLIRPGTVLTLQTDAGEESPNTPPDLERVVVAAIPSATEVSIYALYAHNANSTKVRTDSTANQPCDLVAMAFNSLFLAGDPNNKNVLYKSKTGQPEAFPIVNLNTGGSGSLEVGTPENPIVAIMEFNGQLICMNRSKIYMVRVWRDQMQAPIETPAQRGLFGRHAWCKSDNEVWYVAYDGVYSWRGGESIKRSEAIDPLFKGETIVIDDDTIIYPISFDRTEEAGNNFVSDADRIRLSYHENEIYLLYKDGDVSSGEPHLLRYHTVYDRWSYDTKIPTAMLLEEDIGNLIWAQSTTVDEVTTASLLIDKTPPTLTDPYTTDDWSSDRSDGTSITWAVKTPHFSLGAPTLQKVFVDFTIELKNPNNSLTVETYYDFSNTKDTVDEFTINAGSNNRRRLSFPLKSGRAMEAYSVSFKFTGTTGRRVDLHSLSFRWFPLEQMQRGGAYNWDDLGYPHDKRLQQVTVKYDSEGYEVPLYMDTLSGIDGNTFAAAAQTFTLHSNVQTYPPTASSTGPIHTRVTFPVNDGHIVKMIRMRPDVPSDQQQKFKILGYEFLFEKLPPDKVLFTPWSAEGYPCEKIFRELILDVDTGGVDAAVEVQVDGEDPDALRYTHERVNTTSEDKHRILTLHSDIIGKQVRLLNAPGTGGKFQLFEHKFNWIPEPCKVLNWDGYEQTFGYNGFKVIKQIWVEYWAETGIRFFVYTEDKQFLYMKELPAHDHRDVERFYLPVMSSDDVLNKSKIYRLYIETCDPCMPFKMYKDGCYVEWLPVGADQKQGYQRFNYFEYQPINI